MRLALGLLLSLALVGCSSEQPGARTPPTSSATATAQVVTVSLSDDGRSVEVRAEVARTPDEQRRGLMGRTEVPRGTGMLFVWEDARERSFWMKDTLVALDLLVIRDRRVVQVLTMEPCAEDPCPTYETAPADAALEVASGSLGSPETWGNAQVSVPALGW